MTTIEIAKSAKKASISFRQVSEENKNSLLKLIAENILKNSELIVSENLKDLDLARKSNLTEAMIDRLKLDHARIESMASGVKNISKMEQVVGEVYEENTREDGLKIAKQRIPLGVIAMIFESRPNVVIDCSALAIKSGNAIILKGGKEAAYSNKVLTNIVRDSLEQSKVDSSLVQLVETRESVQDLIQLQGLIDVVIPRGGEKLIQSIYENSKIPVIAHFKGLCHIYIHQDAELDVTNNIITNAKVQRPGVCNAAETLILNKNLGEDFIKDVIANLENNEIQIKGDQYIQSIAKVIPAGDSEFKTEYLDKIINIKTVENLEEAIEHIQQYGSNHTEVIVSNDQLAIKKFQDQVDASCIMVNASSRFNDGSELGLGAELGISTTKLHAYGPMGAREMTTSRFLVVGSGHTRK